MVEHPETPAERLVVTLNGEPQIEYDRGKALPEHQREYLDKMDREMDKGFTLAGQEITHPDPLQRAQFILIHLLIALGDRDEPRAAALCSYLANRIPALREVRAQAHEKQWAVDLVFDENRVNQVLVPFTH